jgi:hypothetical protein
MEKLTSFLSPAATPGICRYLHKSTEWKGTQDISLSHQQDPQMTCNTFQAFLNILVNSCKSVLLTRMYSWPPDTFSLVLEIGVAE